MPAASASAAEEEAPVMVMASADVVSARDMGERGLAAVTASGSGSSGDVCASTEESCGAACGCSRLSDSSSDCARATAASCAKKNNEA